MMTCAALIDTEDARSDRFSTERRVPRMEPVGTCPLCASPDSRVAFAAPDRFCGTPGEFVYRRCAACQTVFQDPKVIREDLPICYPENYYTHDGALNDDGTDSASSRLRSARNLMRRAIKDSVQGRPSSLPLVSLGRVLSLSSRLRARAFNDLVDELIPSWPVRRLALEIGCGAGQLMAKLHCAGWEVEGLEPDPVAADIARKRTGRRVWEGDFAEVELPIGTYHLVALSHVFEHLEDPIGALSRIKELLAPGGRAVLFYPNPRSVGSRAFGDAWTHWDPPRHLVLPPLQSLAKAAESLGFRIVQLRTRTGSYVSYFSRNTSVSTAHRPITTIKSSRVVAALARFLSAFGFDVGEESIIVLQREPSGESK
jgi:SAM-dependent methyltransferase